MFDKPTNTTNDTIRMGFYSKQNSTMQKEKPPKTVVSLEVSYF